MNQLISFLIPPLIQWTRRALLRVVLILLLLSILSGVSSGEESPSRSLYLGEDTTATIGIAPTGTVLSFPSKPAKIFLGKPGSFAIEYVDRDLVITPLSTTSRSNLFVYLFGRRFSFDLRVATGGGGAVIRVHDAEVEPEPKTTQKAGKKIQARHPTPEVKHEQ